MILWLSNACVRFARSFSVPAPRIWLTVYDTPFSSKEKDIEKKKKHLTSLRKWLKGRRQKFDYLPFVVRVNPGRKHGSESLCFARLFSVFGISGHMLSHLCRERAA